AIGRKLKMLRALCAVSAPLRWTALDRAENPHNDKNACTNCTAIEPSPTAEATRLTLPLRTSPAAKTPGMLVSSMNGGRDSPQQGAPSLVRFRDKSEPVSTN